MERLIQAYNLKIVKLPTLYRQLNQEFDYKPGKSSSLGIIFWEEGEILSELPQACEEIVHSGIDGICAFFESVRTPLKLKCYASATGISEKLISILAHDIRMWLPQPVALVNFPLLRDRPDEVRRLESAGITDQISCVSRGRSKADRSTLSKETGLDFEALTENVRICDFFRKGSKIDAIRPVLYYKMGYDTYEKWAKMH